MPVQLRFAVRSDVGLLREGNEDAAYAGPHLVAVADGMGGHAAGEVASRLAISALAELDTTSAPADTLAALQAGLDGAQQAIRQAVAGDEALDGMGTTLTALLFRDSRFGLLHVGDSRAYLHRGGELRQITADHTFVQELVDAGELTEEEAEVHPQRALLTRALDGRSAVEPDLSPLELVAGDRLLLCTDGLSGVVDLPTIGQCLEAASAADAAECLVAAALRGGGPDNITVVVCDVVDDDGQPAAEPATAGSVAEAAGELDAAPAGPGSGAVPAAARPRRGPARRLLLALAGMGVLVGVTTAGLLWLRSQYVVGLQDDHVVIFRGIGLSVGGLRLRTVSEQLAIRPATLPPFERDRLADGIRVASLTQARAVAGRLAASGCASGDAVPPVAAASAGPEPSAAADLAPAEAACVAGAP